MSRLLDRAIGRGWMEGSFRRLAGPALALALLCFGGAELVGGNGLIAAFLGGLTFGHMDRRSGRVLVSFLDAESQLLMLIVFVVLMDVAVVTVLLRVFLHWMTAARRRMSSRTPLSTWPWWSTRYAATRPRRTRGTTRADETTC